MNPLRPRTSDSTDAPLDHRQYLIFIVFIAILGSFSSLVNDMYLPTMPAMREEFHTTTSMTQLGISMAMLGLGLGSVVWGSLSDRYGRKPILILSMSVFVLGTVGALFTRTVCPFLACRLVQGIGAGGSMVLSFSIPADRYTGKPLAVIMAIVGALNGFVPAAAPLVGGFMADDCGWRGIFVLLLVIGLVMLVWATRRPESLPPERRLRTGGIRSYMQAYERLFVNRRFMVYVLTKSISIGLLFSYISSAPFVLQSHYGMSASHFGMLFGANSLAIVGGSMLVARLKEERVCLLRGGLVMCAGAIALAAVLWIDGGILLYEAMLIPMLFGSGMVFSTSNALSMEEGRNDAGSASAILNVVKYIFAAILTPIVGLGDILHSTALVFVAVSLLTLMLLMIIRRLSPVQL